MSESYITKRFLKYLDQYNLKSSWLPWKEWPLYCPLCKKEQYFKFYSYLLVKIENASMLEYRCPVHIEYKKDLIFSHITDDVI